MSEESVAAYRARCRANNKKYRTKQKEAEANSKFREKTNKNRFIVPHHSLGGDRALVMVPSQPIPLEKGSSMNELVKLTEKAQKYKPDRLDEALTQAFDTARFMENVAMSINQVHSGKMPSESLGKYAYALKKYSRDLIKHLELMEFKAAPSFERDEKIVYEEMVLPVGIGVKKVVRRD